MKRITTTLILIIASISMLHAQESNNTSTIEIGMSGDNSISSHDGNISIKLGSMRFDFSSDETVVTKINKSNNEENARYIFAGIGSEDIDHIAVWEIGTNMLSNANYSMYTPEEAAMLQFGNNKSRYLAINLMTMNVALNKSRSLCFEMGFGFAMERYAFAGKYSMEYLNGTMHPVKLQDNIIRSTFHANYIHMPALINVNFRSKFFIAMGVNLDILMGTKLKYRKPKTTIDGEVTLNPIQVGATVRIGHGKCYGFVNYSPMEMFKSGTGPRGNRLSAGVGIGF